MSRFDGHTKGPWHQGAMNDALFVINEKPRPVPTDTINTALKTKIIAKLTEPYQEGWSREEYEKNCLLISAAPDLLHALEEARDALNAVISDEGLNEIISSVGVNPDFWLQVHTSLSRISALLDGKSEEISL